MSYPKNTYNNPLKTSIEIEDQVISQYLSGIKCKTISIEFSIDIGTITEIMRRRGYNITSGNNRNLFQLNKQLPSLTIQYWQETRSLSQIKYLLEDDGIYVSRDAIRKFLQSENLYNATNSKQYSESDIDIVSSLYLDNYTTREIHNKTGLSFWTIRKILKESGFDISPKVKDKTKWELYLEKVRKLTEEQYRLYFYQINPKQYKRSKFGYHLDHCYSISQGFKDSIAPAIIGHYTNLRVVDFQTNINKWSYCSKTKDELLEDYEESKML